MGEGKWLNYGEIVAVIKGFHRVPLEISGNV